LSVIRARKPSGRATRKRYKNAGRDTEGAMTECKYPSCENKRRLGSRFCCSLHRVQYEHVEMDAKHTVIADDHPPERP